MSGVQRLLKYISELRNSREFQNCPLYRSWVSTAEGCLLSGVPLCSYVYFDLCNYTIFISYRIYKTQYSLCDQTSSDAAETSLSVLIRRAALNCE